MDKERRRTMAIAESKCCFECNRYENIDYIKIDSVVKEIRLFSRRICKLEDNFFKEALEKPDKEVIFIELVKICKRYKEPDISILSNWEVKSFSIKQSKIKNVSSRLKKSIANFIEKVITLETFWDELSSIAYYMVLIQMFLEQLKDADDNERQILLNAIANSRY